MLTIPAIRTVARTATSVSSVLASRFQITFRRTLSTTRTLLESPKPERVHFPGATESYFTTDLNFIKSVQPIPTYRVMDKDGIVLDKSQEPQVSQELAVKIYKDMVTLNTMDLILYEAQRQGRISFYMTNFGEEAYIGSAVALQDDDTIFGQYREAGVLLYRGFTLDEFMNQCYSNEHDGGKGRQMPVHYGSRKYNFQTISSPLGTQIPQAAGAAYALKRAGKRNCVICYFGEGAASEGDFHAALNMASTLSTPVIYFCRNNGFAISTPVSEQYAGDGVASRGIGYGIHTIRVDGNDVWAVYNATLAARELALQHQPVLIESLSYRVGHHSTSDDSSKYRDAKKVDDWRRIDNPIARYRKWLEAKGWWDDANESTFRTEIRKEVLRCLTKAEKALKPPIGDLFSDVYDKLTPNLVEQKEELKRLVEEYEEFYPTQDYKGGKEGI